MAPPDGNWGKVCDNVQGGCIWLCWKNTILRCKTKRVHEGTQGKCTDKLGHVQMAHAHPHSSPKGISMTMRGAHAAMREGHVWPTGRVERAHVKPHVQTSENSEDRCVLGRGKEHVSLDKKSALQKLNSRGAKTCGCVEGQGVEGDEDGERNGQALLPQRALWGGPCWWEQSTKVRGLPGCRGNPRKRRGGVSREAPRSQ